MKKFFTLAVMMVMTISANAMSYNAAKHEALFLSDKMAYELNLTAAQYEAVYEINLDYLMSLNPSELVRRWPSRDGGGQSQRSCRRVWHLVGSS